MISELLNNFIYHYNYFILFVFSLVYFLFLYFGLGFVFNFVCKQLYKKNYLQKIVQKDVNKKQIIFEIKYSIKSIIIFGFSIFPIIYFIRIDIITLLPNTVFNILIGLIILTLWNELHFFIVHKIMHTPFLFKNAHYIHHQSKVPTVYSVYSFHWLEALLLSTVPVSIAVFLPFSFLAIAIYPLTSVLINYSGHCNYRFGNGKQNTWLLFGTNHNAHHYKNNKNFGFLLLIFDKIYSNMLKLIFKK